MVKESIQITEESVKLMAAGAKNLAALLLALAQDNKSCLAERGVRLFLARPPSGPWRGRRSPGSP